MKRDIKYFLAGSTVGLALYFGFGFIKLACFFIFPHTAHACSYVDKILYFPVLILHPLTQVIDWLEKIFHDEGVWYISMGISLVIGYGFVFMLLAKIAGRWRKK